MAKMPSESLHSCLKRSVDRRYCFFVGGGWWRNDTGFDRRISRGLNLITTTASRHYTCKLARTLFLERSSRKYGSRSVTASPFALANLEPDPQPSPTRRHTLPTQHASVACQIDNFSTAFPYIHAGTHMN